MGLPPPPNAGKILFERQAIKMTSDKQINSKKFTKCKSPSFKTTFSLYFGINTTTLLKQNKRQLLNNE